MPFCFHQMHSCIPPCRFTFFIPTVERFSFFQLVFRPRKRRMSFSAWHSMEEKLSDRKHLHTSRLFNSKQPECSPPYHPVEFAGHLCRETRRRLQSNSNIFLAGLASTDLFSGLVAQPLRIAVEMKRILGVGPFCTVEKVFAGSLTLVNFATLSQLVLFSVIGILLSNIP